MATQLEIVNKALGHISVLPITSMAESSPAAITANAIWESCRRDCLKGHDWPFATGIVSLSTCNYTIMTNDWTYAYAYPSDCVEVWDVYYNKSDKNTSFRVVYDTVNKVKVILSNVSEAKAEYSHDVTDTTLYDAHFVTVLSYFLAANMAKPLTGDAALAKQMLDVYQTYMSDAERMASYETDIGEQYESRSAFVDARGGSSRISEDHYQAVRHPNG
jgi:hypothetical protein